MQIHKYKFTKMQIQNSQKHKIKIKLNSIWPVEDERIGH